MNAVEITFGKNGSYRVCEDDVWTGERKLTQAVLDTMLTLFELGVLIVHPVSVPTPTIQYEVRMNTDTFKHIMYNAQEGANG